MTAPGREWPLAGRDGELRELLAVITDQPRRGAVIVGPVGVGKTRLAIECLRLADEQGLVTARATATRAATALPFGALAPLLPVVATPEAGPAMDNPAERLRRYAAALVERAGERRLVLFVDDAHLLDTASATLIHQLAATGAAALLLTVRSGEAVPDPIVALWKNELVERFDLGPLDSAAVHDILVTFLGGPVDPVVATRLATHCEGNALFLREVVLGALKDGTLRDDEGMWRVRGDLAPSERLAELVDDRLEGLTDDERDVLEIVALGEPLGPLELNRLGGLKVAELLERKGFLTGERDGRRLGVRLVHPLYGDVLRARMPTLRQRALARSLAGIVEEAGARRREDTLRVGTWRLAGGGARPELMLAAATRARWHGDFPLAERLARAAVDVGAGFDAALLAAQLAGWQGNREEAENELAALALEAVDDRQRGSVATARLDNLVYHLGRIEDGLKIAEEAEKAILDPAWRDEIAARRAGALLVVGPAAAAEAALPLLERAAGGALVWACLVAACSLPRTGKLSLTLEIAERGNTVQRTREQALDWYGVLPIYFRCDALAYLGALEEAESIAAREYDAAVTGGWAEPQAFFAWQLAKLMRERGRVASAVRYGREAIALHRELGYPQYAIECTPHLAMAQALAGAVDDAAAALRPLCAGGTIPLFTSGVELYRARAWTEAAAGDLPRARELLGEAAGLGRHNGDRIGEVTALFDLARFGRPAVAVDRLEAVGEEIEGSFGRVRAAQARALAERNAAGLLAVSATFESTGADLWAAEGAAMAAVIWRRKEDERRAAAAEQRAWMLLDRCQGAKTPALDTLESRTHLTRTEREVALLAAAGRSNKSIAEELHVSVRTVENHLQRVYGKLGLSGRTDLALALGPQAPGTN